MNALLLLATTEFCSRWGCAWLETMVASLMEMVAKVFA
jgi:hypothetical protein